MSEERVKKIGETLVDARNSLADTLAAAGVDATREDRISELAAKADGVVLPHTPIGVSRVSASGYIYPGDFVRSTRELEEVFGVEMRVALGAELLGAVTLPDGRFILLFWQDETAKIKAAKFSDGKIVLGATLALDTVGEDAVLTQAGTDLVAVLYAGEGMGYAQAVSFADLVPTAYEPDIWEDAEPYNIAATMLRENMVAVSCLRRGDTSGAYLRLVGVTSEEISSGQARRFAEGCDADEYEAAWHIAALDENRVIVTWFTAHDEPVRWAIAEYLSTDHLSRGINFYVTYSSQCVYQGSVARTWVIPFGAGLLFAQAVARVSAGQVTKHLLAVEYWELFASGRAAPIWYDKLDQNYTNSLGLVSAVALNAREALVTWETDGIARSAIVPSRMTPTTIVPPVSCGTCGTELIPLRITASGAYTATARSRDGSVYVTIYRPIDTVMAVASSPADGIARTKGEPGGEVSAYMI